MMKKSVGCFLIVLSLVVLMGRDATALVNVEFSWCQAENVACQQDPKYCTTNFKLYHRSNQTSTYAQTTITNAIKNPAVYPADLQLTCSATESGYLASVKGLSYATTDTVYFKLSAVNGVAIESNISNFTPVRLDPLVTVNLPPVANNIGNVSTTEDNPVVVTLNASDPEGTALTYILTDPANGTLTGTAPNLTYNPGLNYNGSDSFTYKVNDGVQDSNIVTVSIVVTPLNDPPVALADLYSVDEDIKLTVLAPGVLSNDNDTADNNTSLLAEIVSSTKNGVLVLKSDGSFTYSPGKDFFGTDSFTYKVNDSGLTNNYSNQVKAVITINPINDKPLIADIPNQTVARGTPFTIVPLDNYISDVDNIDSQISWTVTSNTNPSNFITQINGSREAIVTATQGWVGGEILTFTASDGQYSKSDTALFEVKGLTISVIPSDITVANNGDTFTVNADITDAEDLYDIHFLLNYDPLAVSVTSAGVVEGSFLVASTSTNRKTLFIGLLRKDTAGNETGVIEITTALLFDQNLAVNSGATGSGTVATIDFTVKNIDYMITNLKDGNKTNDPVITFSEVVLQDSKSVNLVHNTLNSKILVNRSPGIVSSVPDQVIDEGAALTIELSSYFNDPDGDPLTYTASGLPAKYAVFDTTTGIFTFSPLFDYLSGLDFIDSVLTFRATDNKGDSSLDLNVNLRTNNVNRIPVAADKAFSTDEDIGVFTTLSGTDKDGDVLTFSVVTNPLNGTITGTAPNLTYNPVLNYNGSDSFTYRVNDGRNDSAAATVTITINPVNDLPFIISGPTTNKTTVDEETSTSVNVTAMDPEGSVLTYNWSASSGTISGTGGAVNYTAPAVSVDTDVTITVIISDIEKGSVSGSVVVHVLQINKKPAILSVSPGNADVAAVDVEIMEGVEQVFSVTASDPDGDTLTTTWALKNADPNDQVKGSGTSFNYRPSYATTAAPYNNTITLTATVSDGALSDSRTWTIIVEDVMQGDFVTDRFVDYKDLFKFVRAFNSGNSNKDCTTAVADARYHELFDFNNDCYIDYEDMFRMVKSFNSGIKLYTPNGGETIDAGHLIEWYARDPNSVGTTAQNLSIDVSYSEDGGATWVPVADPDGGLNDRVLNWDTTSNTPGSNYKIRLSASNGAKTFMKTDESDAPFTVSHNAGILAVSALFNVADNTNSDRIRLNIAEANAGQVKIEAIPIKLEDLHDVNFNIRFDPLRFSVESVKEGDVLKSSGGDTLFVKNIDNENGRLTLTTALLGDGAGVTNEGVIAYITFNELTSEELTLSELRVNSVVLQNSASDDIFVSQIPTEKPKSPSAGEPAEQNGVSSDNKSSAGGCFISSIIN